MKPWFLHSNRSKHIIYGLAIYVCSFISAILIGTTAQQAAIVALTATATAAVVKEYTDKQHQGPFDRLDILVTVLIPFLFTSIVIIFA